MRAHVARPHGRRASSGGVGRRQAFGERLVRQDDQGVECGERRVLVDICGPHVSRARAPLPERHRQAGERLHGLVAARLVAGQRRVRAHAARTHEHRLLDRVARRLTARQRLGRSHDPRVGHRERRVHAPPHRTHQHRLRPAAAARERLAGERLGRRHRQTVGRRWQ